MAIGRRFRRESIGIVSLWRPSVSVSRQRWSAHVDDPAVQIDMRRVLSTTIGELPTDYRAVIVLRDIQGLSNSEIGEALGISVTNVKSSVHRARLFLRKRLATYMSALPVADCVA